MKRVEGAILLVDAPDDLTKPFYFLVPCYGLCTEHLHTYVAADDDMVRVRHGDGEAQRVFTVAEYKGIVFLEWIASVHRYEEGR